MDAVVWMNLEDGAYHRLSNKACALLFHLFLKVDNENQVHKSDFLSSVSWIKDRRTANKYWKELEKEEVILHLERKLWMVSPYECFRAEATHEQLVDRWTAVKSTQLGD